MLLSKQIEQLAADYEREANGRPYIKALIPDLCTNRNFWQMLIEILEIILHRRGYLIVKAALIEEAMKVPQEEAPKVSRDEADRVRRGKEKEAGI
ncbi:MAG: hypothetical protein JO029_10455 [Candidatus Eremiobacteraeota bacterium]|nr:hypothetical protein [Candidatus Eremiobacteraeota bacterium]